MACHVRYGACEFLPLPLEHENDDLLDGCATDEFVNDGCVVNTHDYPVPDRTDLVQSEGEGARTVA